MSPNDYKRQYEKYPSIISLYEILDENNNKKGRKYVTNIISEYNCVLKLITKCYLLDLTKYLVYLLRKEYISRIQNDCKCLSGNEKNHLKNYIVARYRELLFRNMF